MKAPKNKFTFKNISSLSTEQVNPLIQKLVKAYEVRDFSILTLQDLDRLVVQGYLHPETSARLAWGSNHVS